MTIDDYLDLARQRAGITSDRQLSLSLGLAGATVSQFRTGRAFPADDTMVRLAELAGIPTDQSLCDLNRWRAPSDAVRSIYARMASRLAGSALALLAFSVPALLELPVNKATASLPDVYIMRKTR